MTTFKTLIRFDGTGGRYAQGSLYEDASGDLYGTTTASGAAGAKGTVFEIPLTAAGYAATPVTLVTFDGTDGAGPVANLIADASGNLFGTTEAGGASNQGTVFEVVKTASGYSGTPITIASFDGRTNGAYPNSIEFDASGNLIGDTLLDDDSAFVGDGSIFEIAKTASGYSSSITTLFKFNGADGANPNTGLVFDASGDVFGTTGDAGLVNGGFRGGGTVFELAKTSAGYAATPVILAGFSGESSNPQGGLLQDAAGNLLGTTANLNLSAPAAVFGSVFEIFKGASGYFAPVTLATFNRADAGNPQGTLVEDAAGNLYGTTQGAFATGATVFELPKTGNGYGSAPITLARLDGPDGGAVVQGPIIDANGDLFGSTGPIYSYDQATLQFSHTGYGTVYEVSKAQSVAAGAPIPPKTLADFRRGDGVNPEAGLVADSAGNLFGTTLNGGVNGDGTVFEIAKTASGYAAVPVTLASFGGADGAKPDSPLYIDASGNLFGATTEGGASNYGSIFELAKTGSSYATGVTTLVSFDGGVNGGTDLTPESKLTADAAGNLYGTTAGGDGTIFEIAKTGSGYAASPTTLVTFAGADGATPTSAGLIMDSVGNLFGVTEFGGANGDGEVFELRRTAGGYAAAPTVLASFNGTDGADPRAGLVMDASGSLIGTTSLGGADGEGTVFEIPVSATGLQTLADLTDATGGYSEAPLLIGADGSLYGTTALGGSYYGAVAVGTVFKLAKTAAGYSSAPAVLATFTGIDGTSPLGGLIQNAAGDLIGTTSAGGTDNDGTVFQIDASALACYGRGTRIATPDGERPVETLRPGDEVLTASGRTRTVRWTGRRRIACDGHPDPRSVRPVRVRAEAFGPGLPRRDLFLSPDHAVLIGGALIPIKHLANGGSVAQMSRRSVEYHHVELDTHDVLIAEGLPAESYLDTGDRDSFDGASAVRLHPAFGASRAAEIWESSACAPLAVTGPAVEAARSLLRDRAAALAPRLKSA